MSFLVTGSPRSATLFLAKQLNKSQEWQVEHEPDTVYWDSERWGCVDARVWARTVDCHSQQLAVLVRHPLRIYLSWMNIYGLDNKGQLGKLLLSKLRRSPQMVKFLDRLITQKAVHLFKFHEITTCPEAILEGARVLGITDLSSKQIETGRKRHVIDRHGYTMDDIPTSARARIEDRCGWFVEKYELPCV